jgi:CHAD domain-containing protein
METEAKFSFQDEAAFKVWLGRSTLGPFALGPERVRQVVDHYLDSRERACLAQGYACRVRLSDGRAVVTLKSLADMDGAGNPSVRRREELEVTLESVPEGVDVPVDAAPGDRWPAGLQPDAWPESEARSLALRLLGGAPLCRLVSLRQERHERELQDRERTVALASFDRVTFAAGRPPLLELEVELEQGGEDDMEEVVAVLSGSPDFEPAPRSKLGSALQAVGLAFDEAGGSPATPDGDLVRALFAAVAPSAGLSTWQPVLDVALRLLDEGAGLRPDRPAVAARDLLPARRAPELDEQQAGVLAAVVALLAELSEPIGKPHAVANAVKEAPALAALPAKQHPAALGLTALIALGRALTAAGRVELAAVTLTPRRAVLSLAGPDGKDAADAAKEHAALWREALGTRLKPVALAEGERPPYGLRYDRPQAEAARALLRGLLARFDEAEPELRRGDEEGLHDARVAVRRMRTALQLFDAAFSRRETRPLLRDLKALGDRLGAVRDLDVLIASLREDPAFEGCGPIADDLEARQERGRTALFAYLDGQAYRDTRDALAAFVAGSSRGRRGDERLCDAAPTLVWRRWGAVRAYEAAVETASLDELHELRKDAKRLRYALEFLGELLGRQAKPLVEEIVTVQDALGVLHDAAVLRDLIERRLAKARGAEAAPLRHCLDRTLIAITERRRDFASAWPALTRRDFRHRLAEVLAEL